MTSVLFSQVLQSTQEKLSQASKTIDKAFVRTRSIERKLRGVEELDEGESKKLLGDIYEDTDTDHDIARRYGCIVVRIVKFLRNSMINN